MIEHEATESASSSVRAQVLAAVASRPGSTTAELTDETGLVPEAVRQILRELSHRGIVWRPLTGYQAGRWRLVTQPPRRR